MQDRSKFISYLSPAKLNLGLKVVGIRDDGYHLLNTVFCLINLFDKIDIQIVSNKKISLISHNQAWHYSTDLAYKAARYLQEFTACEFGANIKVNKVIPSGAGLGGGSSNAATVLIALNHLWNLNLDYSTLHQIGIKLGADVPFFLYGRNAFATGIGDVFQAIDIEDKYYILIKPDCNISTSQIFKHYKFNAEAIKSYNYLELLNNPVNDLQPIALKLYPELNNLIDTIILHGNPVMTGSGSVFYLSFTDKNIANNVANKLKKMYNVYFVNSIKASPLLDDKNV
ncbi:MAG: 4-(cytidine 5'-diphospho)-2-C-methyl-D-erythritol kinase [Burkholderiales bacterium]|nr:4-(cytidine 5'-diphospho)-2-C-methyl-D-erythritol kinase [Burkholderiales bacterium]